MEAHPSETFPGSPVLPLLQGPVLSSGAFINVTFGTPTGTRVNARMN
jgi:hypothetical protein